MVDSLVDVRSALKGKILVTGKLTTDEVFYGRV